MAWLLVEPALWPIYITLACIAAIALTWVANKVVEALFQQADSKLGWLPWAGRWITGSLHSIQQRLSQKLNEIASGLQARLGTSWHATARILDEAAHKIADAFEVTWRLAQYQALFAPLRSVIMLYRVLAKAISGLHSTTKAQTAAINHAGRLASDAQRRADTAKVRAQAIPADVVLPRDLSGLRGRVREAENEISRLWDRVRGISPAVIGGVALGALTFALGRLGLGWARCSNVGKVGRRICGLDQNLLESLLLDTLAIVGTVSLIEFIRDAQAIEAVALDALGGFIREFPKV